MSKTIQNTGIQLKSNLHRLAASGFALAIFVSQAVPAFATIDNTATVKGTYTTPNDTTATSSTVKVPVTAATYSMSIAVTAATPTISSGTDATMSDAGDKIDVTYTVTNSGTGSLTAFTPNNLNISFNNHAGTPANFSTLVAVDAGGTPMTAPTQLLPGGTQNFKATYTLTQLDVDRAAGAAGSALVTADATATAQSAETTPKTVSATKAAATTTILGVAKLAIDKTDTLPNGKTTVALGDIVTYTYKVHNIGYVAVTNVQIDDKHGFPQASVPLGTTNSGITNESVALVDEGPLQVDGASYKSSDDATPNNGIWGTLQPGATVTFTWAHTVTQAEIDHG